MDFTELRPATRDKLGAVKIGDSFKISEDGVLNVDENFIEREEYIEFSRARLQELFLASKPQRR